MPEPLTLAALGTVALTKASLQPLRADYAVGSA